MAVEWDGRRVEKRLPGRQGRLVIAFLALNRSRPVSRDELMDVLWPGELPGSADTALSALLSKLRAALSREAIAGRRHLELAPPGPLVVDFEVAMSASREAAEALARGEVELARAAALRALEIAGRGFLLGDDAPWVEERRRELSDARIDALEVLARASLELGVAGLEEAERAAREVVAEAPFRESAYVLLMRVLDRRGERAEALRAYEDLRRTLDRELGAIPGEEARQLHAQLLTEGSTVPRADTRIRYADSGGVSIAYRVIGEGPRDVVFVPGFVSHLEVLFEAPEVERFFGSLAESARVVLYDKREQGLSDRTGRPPTLEEAASDLLAVLDAVGAERPTLLGMSEGGPISIIFAASHPERCSNLALIGSYARLLSAIGYDAGVSRAAVDALVGAIRARWGTAVGIELFLPSGAHDQRVRDWWARLLRQGTSPGGVQALMDMYYEMDVRVALPALALPVLVIHRRGDKVSPVANGRHLAGAIPGARYVELEGVDHIPAWGDVEPVLKALKAFVMEARPAVADRMLGTVLALDVGEHPGGPPARDGMRWPRAASQADRLLRAEIERHGGRVLRGPDGTVTLFSGPTRAIVAAAGARAALESIGLFVRAAIHAGECEVVGERVDGYTLQTCAALAAKAAPGELLVTGVVADLMAGASLVLEPRGELDSGADPGLRVHAVRDVIGGAAH